MISQLLEFHFTPDRDHYCLTLLETSVLEMRASPKSFYNRLQTKIWEGEERTKHLNRNFQKPLETNVSDLGSLLHRLLIVKDNERISRFEWRTFQKKLKRDQNQIFSDFSSLFYCYAKQVESANSVKVGIPFKRSFIAWKMQIGFPLKK